MLILGLTGSIGMGKSTAANWLRSRGIAVFDADGEVHKLYAGAAVPLIEAAFPGTTSGGAVDRVALSAALASKPEGFVTLEAIVHPLARAAERAFLLAEHARHAKIAAVEIPLLFETGADTLCDAVVVVSTDAATQRARVMGRAGMTAAKFEQLLGRQMSDAEKRSRADFVVDTSGPVTDTQAQIDKVLLQLAGWPETAFGRDWEA
jgi:dephospho-CoA kinase